MSINCDVLIIGGGINGAGIARDAAGRGLSVVLCEKDDLAAHTSSASTKLIHGGLRYLEHREFGLVRKALIERELLLRAAPHIMRPLQFVLPVLPHDHGQRPAWMIRIGLFIYDHLARRALLPASHAIDLHSHIAGAPLKAEFERGFVYADGWVDDARLVILNAIDARERGATILTRCRCESIVRDTDGWVASLRSDVRNRTVHARCVVNAAGPWAIDVLHMAVKHPVDKKLRLIKGSHIIVKKLFDHPYAYIFQHPDQRIVFAIPYETNFTLIGTTDLEFHGNPDQLAIDDNEIAYLCDLANRYFQQPITSADVVWSYSGVRPLVEDAASNASAVTRDYRFAFDTDGAPLLSIFGGKITTFRKLAEQAVDLITAKLGSHHGAWTAGVCLPGGDLFRAQPENRAVLEFDAYVALLQRRYAWLPPALVARYARAYGTRIDLLLRDRTNIADMGMEIGAGLFAAEVEYWIEHEWAVSPVDMLWRRSKLGLHLSKDARNALASWLSEYGPDISSI